MNKHLIKKSNGNIPEHVAIIMDGNGRWAMCQSKTRRFGHQAGVSIVKKIVKHAVKKGISYLTLFAFSTENWSRSGKEVYQLMRLFVSSLEKELDDLHRNNVKLKFIGSRQKLKNGLIQLINDSEEKTLKNTGLTLTTALAYGGRWDIVNATRKIATRIEKDDLNLSDINEKTFSDHLSLSNIPAPDILIRTGGENRVSNFLLWDLAYTEIYFTNVLWPDFQSHHFDEFIQQFKTTKRRFGYTDREIE